MVYPETNMPRSTHAALSNAEVAALRDETSACAHVLHFNHAGDSPTPRPILDTVIAHLEQEARIGGYEAANEAADRLDAVYASIARLVGGRPDEIAVVENATRAWDMLFYSIPFALGDRILTTASEYGSNVIPFLQVAKRGVSVEVIPNTSDGHADPTALATMLDERVKLVSVTHMPTNGGLVQDAAEIGAVLKASGSSAIYLLDACQTIGQLPLDVSVIGCHALSATSRKYLRGPRGMGFLWIDLDLARRLEPPFLDIHAAEWISRDDYEVRPDAQRFENWESNVAAKLGLGHAVDYALDIGLDRIWATVSHQAATLRDALRDIPGVMVHDLGSVQGGIVVFTVENTPAATICDRLHAQAINVSVSSTSSTRYDMEARGLTDLVRSSVHYLTTRAEIDQLTEQVRLISTA